MFWDGFYLFVDSFYFILVEEKHCEMRCDKPEPWRENKSFSRVFIFQTLDFKGSSHSFNKSANVDVAIATPFVTGDDIVHTEQIRVVWNGNEKYCFF